jgi:uncharacterized YceG family protein
VSGGYPPGGHTGQGHGAPDYDGDPGEPGWPAGQRQWEGSVWQNDQDHASYGDPGYGAPGYPGQDFGQPGYGGQDAGFDAQPYGDQPYEDQTRGDYGHRGPDVPGYGQADPRPGPAYAGLGPAAGGYEQPRTGPQPGQPGYAAPSAQPRYDQQGYDQQGYDQQGYDQQGYDQQGYDQQGYDQQGTGPRRPAGDHGQHAAEPPRGPGGYPPGGYGDREQDPGETSFLPGFGRGDDYGGDRPGGPEPERDGRYDEDGYDGRRGPRAARPDAPGFGAAPGGPGRGPGGAGGGPADPGDRGTGPRGSAGAPRDRDIWDDRDPRPRRRRATRWAPRILLLVIFGALVIGGTVGGLSVYHKYQARYHPADYAGAGTGAVTVQVQSGEDADQLAPTLLQLGVVASTRAFVMAAEASTNPAGLEPGYYQLHHHMQASLAWAALLDSKNRVQTVVTIPEGKRAVDVIAILSAKTKIPLKDFQQVLDHPAQLGLPSYADGKVEGYLFPATYAIVPHETALQILQAMVQRFDVEAQQVNLAAAAQAVGLSSTQLIIEASLAQAEGGSVSDYPKIAEVIHNRLAAGMHLQFDSTVLYGLGKYAVSATFAEINTPGPYNTYLNKGLPAGPISNPGDAAIQGILHADRGNWLYFLTKPGGKSQFSATPLSGQ